MANTKNEVFIYSRKSKFSGAGESIENQIELCKDYATRIYPQGCNFHIYEDEGFSAKNVERPQWQQLTADMEHGDCDTLICYRLDRISRNVSDFSSIMDYLVDHEISFISVRENFDTTTPMGRAMIYIASVFAQLERETITERVKDNKFKLYRTGRWQGGTAPLGFRAVKSSFQDEDGSKRHMFVLEGVPDEQTHVQMLFDKFVELGSLTALDSYLLKQKIYSFRGNEYTNATLRQILVNPIYVANSPIIYDYLRYIGCNIADDRDSFDGSCGLIAYARTVTKGAKKTTRTRTTEKNWIIATGYHAGLIPSEQWIFVQQTIRKNGQQHPRQGTSNIALLSGIIYCQQCDAPMMVKCNRNLADGTKAFTYICNRKSRSHSKLCNVQNLQGRNFDQYIVNTLKETFSSGGKVLSELTKSFHMQRTEKIDYQKQLKLLERKIEGNIEASTRLATKMAYTQSVAEDDALRRAIQQLFEEKTALSNNLNLLRQEAMRSESILINTEMIKRSVFAFTQNFSELPLDEQRISLKSVVSAISWNGENAEINLFPACVAASKKNEPNHRFL